MTQDYIRHFGKPQTEVKHIFSPYRVCPIGAHVDHQHGLVTGFAIDKGGGIESSIKVVVFQRLP